MTAALSDHSLDQIFRSARTFSGWADRPVEDATVREIYDLMKWGPTSATPPVWTRPFFPARESSRTLSAALATAIQLPCFRAILALVLRRPPAGPKSRLRSEQ